MKEVWKPIPEYPGYQASSLGRIRSHIHVVVGGYRGEFEIRDEPSRVLKADVGKKGYHRVGISVDKKTKTINVYVLILLAFVGPKPHPKMWAAHWDGDKDNNKPSNLRWATPKENIADKRRHGTHAPRRGEQMHQSKLNKDSVIDIRRSRKLGIKQDVLAEKYGVTQSTISLVENGKAWGHI